MCVNSKRLILDSERDVIRRLNYFLKIFNRRYSMRFIGKKSILPHILYSTQHGLESDKLGLVLYNILYRKYYAPIIVVRGHGGRLYILDGHHRARAYLWLRELVDAYIIEAIAYKPRYSIILSKTSIINPPVTYGEPVRSLRHMVNIICFLEKSHRVIARVWRERVGFDKLYATQPLVKPVSSPLTKDTPPPLIYRLGDEYYVVDGHTRVCASLLYGESIVDSIVFTLNCIVGLIKTSESLGKPRIDYSYCMKSSNK